MDELKIPDCPPELSLAFILDHIYLPNDLNFTMLPTLQKRAFGSPLSPINLRFQISLKPLLRASKRQAY
jgi:hypothetical protein